MLRQLCICSLVFLAVSTSTFAGGMVANLSVDLDGQVVLGDNYDNAMTIAPNLALVIDLVFSRTANSDVGLGVEYQKERPWFGEQTIQFTPIYGFINHYGSSRTRGPQPYLTGRLGYNYFSGPNSESTFIKSQGGLYYKLGLGLNFQNKFRIEANYSSSQGQEKTPLVTLDYTYNRTSICFGVVF
ncbi:MAG: hypothetical protein GX766_08515 [Firmicutes bacterium]|jgi:hypothetical protein|nr:hypothetical protein [Bacillota bacterium]HQD40209.1 hypothetical protein [Bacillota bacterium]